MTKNRWESMKSLGSHIDPEKDEELRGTKLEIDAQVTKVMKLIRNKHRDKREGNSRRDSELIQFIQDFHKQYQSLYALYDNLRGEVRAKVNGKEEKDDSSSSSSSYSSSSSSSSTPSSDSETYYSPYETGSKSSESRSERRKVRESLKQKLENSNLEVAELKNKLSSVNKEKEALNFEYTTSLSKVQESEIIIEGLKFEAEQTEITKQKLMNQCSQLKEKLSRREKEFVNLSKTRYVGESKQSAQIKKLESEVTSLRLKLETLYNQKRELEEKIEKLGEENVGLISRISELKMESKAKEIKVSDLKKEFGEKEKNLKSKVEDLMEKTSTMQVELGTLRAQKRELEERLLSISNEESAQSKGVMDQVNVFQQELKSLDSQRSESESQVEKQTQVMSDFLNQIENLKEKLATKTLDEERTLQEKESLEVKVKDLKVELEEQIRGRNRESDQLSVENNGLHVRILELEKSLMERANEHSNLQKTLEGTENDSFSQIKALGTQIENLKKDLDLLQTEKNQLESQKKDSLENLTQIEKKNIELSSTNEDLERTLKEKDCIINNLNEDIKQEKVKVQESKSNLQIAERKSEEMAEEFCKKFEDNLRLLSRRIRVAEQLHVENKDFYRKTKEKYEQEHVDLKEWFANNEVAFRNIKDISLTANDLLAGLDSVALKFEECGGNFLNRISKVSCELKFAKDWVRRKNNAIKHVKEDVDCLLAQLDVKEVEILGYREKVWKLENKARELEKMVKEREEGMLGLGEEKREAIRQLCVWIDYHRSRSDYLKKLLSEMSIRSQRTT